MADYKLNIDKLPFYTGMQNAPFLTELPASLPFNLFYDPQLELIVRENNQEVDDWVQKAYEMGSSLSTPLGDGSFSQQIAQDMIAAIRKSLGKRKIEECSFLEVGCGQGYLLYLLQEMGAKSCLGIEPDPRSQEGAAKYKINIIQDFFDSRLLQEEFDVIFSYCVLEHIQNPLEFMQELKKCSKKGGLIFSAVPNCEKGLALGDLSLMAHEHYNYFTPRSLCGIYQKAGLTDIQYGTADYGWALYVWGENHDSANISADDSIIGSQNHEKELYQIYTEHCWDAIEQIQAIIQDSENKGKSIGVYGAHAYFMMFEWRQPPRFFDGDTAKHGLHLPGSPNPIESPYVLRDNPVDIIFVAPINYDREIRSLLQNEMGISDSQIISMKEIYANIHLKSKE